RREVIRRGPEAERPVAGVVGQHHQRTDEAADEEIEADGAGLRLRGQDQEFPVVGEEPHAERAPVKQDAGGQEGREARDDEPAVANDQDPSQEYRLSVRPSVSRANCCPRANRHGAPGMSSAVGGSYPVSVAWVMSENRRCPARTAIITMPGTSPADQEN